MKILFVSRSSSGSIHPFVKEQADVLVKQYRLDIKHFVIEKGGMRGYMSAAFQLREVLKHNNIDFIHVHYGLSALSVVLAKVLLLHQKKIIITYHGSDLNDSKERPFSLLASKFAIFNILVSSQMTRFFSENYAVIPCGIDTDIKTDFRDMVRLEKGWGPDDFVILFSSNFTREEKDPTFAKRVVNAFKKSVSKRVFFLELKGYNRSQLTQLMQAADVLLMCSIREGSPQIIKESILNSLPIVSNDVGEVKTICTNVDNCFIVEKNIPAFVHILCLLAENPQRIANRQPLISRYDNKVIAGEIFKIYQNI